MIGAFNRRRKLLRDRRGVTAVEFAIVAPVMIMMIMALGEITYEIYLGSILEGALQKAGRDITLETASGSTTTIDDRVKASILQVANRATFVVSRKNFHDFSTVHPEPYTDANHNGSYDSNECFSDENGNGSWDSLGGETGVGGANDVVVYTMTVTYPRPFPVSYIIGGSSTQTAKASTILRSQPYGTQAADVTPPVICPT